jgi:general secretion pathway protein G
MMQAKRMNKGTGYRVRGTGKRKRDPEPRTLNPGFTMIELMLVVVIIGCLAAMVMPRLSGRSEQAYVSAARADVTANIPTALKLYELDNGSFPATSDGLGALLQKPPLAANWRGPYLDRKPIDPWGREYKYVSPGIHRPQDYDLSSLGKDGAEGNDDIANWD